MSDAVKELLQHDHASLVAPAGYGKTETIAQFVAQSEGKQLVLTHTHAGVQSLAKRFKKYSVNSSKFELDTISGWALRMANYYPQSTAFTKGIPSGDDWPVIVSGVANLLKFPFIKRVISQSYTGVIVDEYQDCNLGHHSLILALAEVLPCRVVGDPLQGIYSFAKGEKLVDWDIDVKSYFTSISELTIPYRWQNTNLRLGGWLKNVREKIYAEQTFDLPSSVVNHVVLSDSSSRATCYRLMRTQNDTVVAIHPELKHANSCHTLASQLIGNYQSIEEVDAKELQKHAKKFDNATGNQRAVVFIDFASDCMTIVSSELRTIRANFENSKSQTLVKKNKHIIDLLSDVAQTGDISKIKNSLKAMRHIVNSKNESPSLYRADLFDSMMDALTLFESGNYASLVEAAWNARQRQKHIGRREYTRIVSRTLLIKGLEYQHAILLDADKFDSKNLYVALTRGSTSLTIISKEPRLTPK